MVEIEEVHSSPTSHSHDSSQQEPSDLHSSPSIPSIVGSKALISAKESYSECESVSSNSSNEYRTADVRENKENLSPNFQQSTLIECETCHWIEKSRGSYEPQPGHELIQHHVRWDMDGHRLLAT